jgi:hypothetical protein
MTRRTVDFALNRNSCLPVEVPPRLAGPSPPGRRGEPGDTTTEFDGPRVVMEEVMVSRAEQYTVVDARRTTPRPRREVVCLAPARRDGTVRERTALVPGHERPPKVRWEQPLCTSEVQDLPCATEDQRDDVGITGDPPDAPCTDLLREDGVTGPPGLADQVLVADGHHHLRTMPARCGQTARRQGDTARRD